MPRKKLVRAGFTFFPNDWLSDTGLNACTLGARGLWVEMLARMFKSPKRGYLLMPNGEPIGPVLLASLSHAPEGDVTMHLAELKAASIFSQTCTGTVFCRRMLRDIRKLAEYRKDNEKKKVKANSNYSETTKKPSLPVPVSVPVPVPKDLSTKTRAIANPKSIGSYPPEFIAFWDSYPRKVGSKQVAYKAWAKVAVNGTREAILTGLEAWKKCVQWRDEEYIPYPATFLNQRRWENAPAVEKGGFGYDLARFTGEKS